MLKSLMFSFNPSFSPSFSSYKPSPFPLFYFYFLVSKHKNTYTCPFKGCKQTHETLNLIKDHLLTNHANSLHKIQEPWWKNNHLHPCPNCNNKAIFNSQGFLNRHILRKHNQTEKKRRLDPHFGVPKRPTDLETCNSQPHW